MIRLTIPFVLLVSLAAAETRAELPDSRRFTTSSGHRIGFGEADGVFVALDAQSIGPVTRLVAVAYGRNNWKRPLRRAAGYLHRDGDDHLAEKFAEPRAAADRLFERYDAVEATSLMGAFTGRFRHEDSNLVIWLEDDEVRARTDELGRSPQKVLLERVSRRQPCKGKRGARLLEVVVRPDWRAIALYVEASCTPDDGGRPEWRRDLVVIDARSILSEPQTPVAVSP